MWHSCRLLGMRTGFLARKGFLAPRGFPLSKSVFPLSKRVFPLSERVSFPFKKRSFSLPQKDFLAIPEDANRGVWDEPSRGARSLIPEPGAWLGNASGGSFCWIHGIGEGLCSYVAGGRGSATKGVGDPWKSHGPEPGSWLGNASGGSFSWIGGIRESGNQGRAAAVPLPGRRPGLRNKRDWGAG